MARIRAQPRECASDHFAKHPLHESAYVAVSAAGTAASQPKPQVAARRARRTCRQKSDSPWLFLTRRLLSPATVNLGATPARATRSPSPASPATVTLTLSAARALHSSLSKSTPGHHDLTDRNDPARHAVPRRGRERNRKKPRFARANTTTSDRQAPPRSRSSRL